MKLKKIASLALAGIMAVSMLAGCSGKTENEENNGNQNQVAAATVADYANSLLSKEQKNVFEFENSADLTAALKKVASDSEKFTSEDIEVYSKLYAYNASIVVSDLATELKKDLELDFSNSNASGDNQQGLAITNKKGTKTVGFVYGVSGKLEQDTAVQLIINSWKGTTMDNGTYFPATITPTSSSTKLDCDYTAEISAVKVTAPDDKDVSTWVVAIVVTQTAVEAANV